MPQHSSIINVDGVEFTHGPDAHRGGNNCRTQHEGTREGILDSCCCCDPCRYKRPPFNGFTGFSCRCVPRLICMTFTPDVGADDCCRVVSFPMVAVFNSPPRGPHYDNTEWSITYTGTISGITCTLTISTHSYNGPAFWKVDTSSTAGTASSEIEIDHLNVTCLSVPDISVTGVVDLKGCTGTITFSNYDSSPIPFNHTPPTFEEFCELIDTPPNVQCNCQRVPRYLCVDGVRHVGDDREQVRFEWNEDLGDRWSYLPCDGNVSTDQEHIYLRGDHYGNCYLELDFEQSGSDTNDWPIPSNTLGSDIHEIRDGMIAIESCGRDIYAQSQIYDRSVPPGILAKYVTITAGECGCWKYACGRCRCVPNSICVIGQIDGEIVEGVAAWDGEKWVFAGDTYTGPFSILLAKNDCGDCVLRVNGSFAVPFQDSLPVECGEFLASELFSEYDPAQPSAFNQLWVQSSICECNIAPCGICADDRCGGPPKTIYFEIEMDSVFETEGGTITTGYDVCNITIPLQYFQRLQAISVSPGLTIVCGYVGYKVVYCPAAGINPAYSFVVQVSITYFQGNFQWEMSRAELNGGPLVFNELIIPNTLFPPTGWTFSCDPFVVDSGPPSNMGLNCRWGCYGGSGNTRIAFVE